MRFPVGDSFGGEEEEGTVGEKDGVRKRERKGNKG